MEQSQQDHIRIEPAKGLAATLDLDHRDLKPGSDLPPCWHWLYFLDQTPARALSVDGHEKLGGFIPETDLPRRMWAGSRMRFHQPLRFGEQAARKTVVKDVRHKQGRSGRMAFITLAHEITGDQGGHITDEHDIVYREAPRQGEPTPAPIALPDGAEWSEEITPDPVMLFRYSALTFNGHRIHYDRDFCRDEEGYSGLVFHGPLTATCLLEALHKAHPDRNVEAFTFRATAPLFDNAPFQVAGKLDGDQAQLWAITPEGGLAMEATATLRSG
ncbi:FAS1-like dehydratase domain-containing protein [Aestuariispira insulae]|uniref:3-methylfumaryl-CoA hydratase n=1 Tax=Aestuariispira insulae TaxID=1461337 RepID=A0A3D9HGZ0_9PROT|nr:MaoC family dehydratase N-terminal domain-containing protein [Aestuariispira insulae]RED48521.1 3-methylfumaryl-CoA hydratase [Aestuariispira insulae]